MPTSTVPIATTPPALAREVRSPAWPRLLAWALLFTTLGVLNAVHFYLAQSDSPEPRLLLILLVEELTGSWSAGLLLPMVVRTARRIRAQPRRATQAASHVGMLLLFSALHTTLIAASRHVAFPLVGLGPSLYGWTFHRAAMEFPAFGIFICCDFPGPHYSNQRL